MDKQANTRGKAATADRRKTAMDAAHKMGAAPEPQHLSADQPGLDPVDAASADSFPASDPPAVQSRID